MERVVYAREILGRHGRNAAESVAETLRSGWDRLTPVAWPYVRKARVASNETLGEYEPWQVAVYTAIAVLGLVICQSFLWSCRDALREKGLKQRFFDFARSLPVVRGVVAREQAKVRANIAKTLAVENTADNLPFTALPREGLSQSDLQDRLHYKAGKDVVFSEGGSRVSGTLYMAGKEHVQLLNEVYTQFSHTNPMHTDIFPSVRQMESEVIAMTASFLGGGKAGDVRVCGAMTSGGTESILSAVKASRDYMRATRGVRQPEMIVGSSAHAAFYKAAEYFRIRLIRVPVGADYRLSAAQVKKHISGNTVLIVASAPGFPHGVVDHIEELGKAAVDEVRNKWNRKSSRNAIDALAQQYRVPLHSDACLGGFVLPFARKLGYRVPAFDFAVPGVTSMSVDTHKFGMAHKGTSIVLYRNPELRRHQYTQITEWTGGLYISPGFAGSRSGALIATAWASMTHLGEQGYLSLTEKIMKASKRFEDAVRAMVHLEVVGNPEMSVVAFRARDPRSIDIFKVNDLMSKRGWHLSALQLPSALHMCFTAQHVDSIDELVKDLEETVLEVLSNPAASESGMAPLYGMNAKMPDRSIIGEFLTAYQDALLSI